jgi:hypothetical protein
VSDRPLPIEEALTLLAAAPRRIAGLSADLTPAQLRTAPGPDEWSTSDVLAHLRACADVWGDSIRAILARDHPTLRYVSPRTWIRRTDYPDLAFLPSLGAFTTQRTELLAILEPLQADGWSRAASVKKSGKLLEMTVLSYAQQLVRHEQLHIEQVERIVATLHA